MSERDAVTVSITRTVKPGREAEFERALHDFVQRSFDLPGQLGVHILRPAPDSGSREYGIVRKFANHDALAAFRSSPRYLEWSRSALDLTEGGPRMEELCGLESWFTLPGSSLRPLPKWKMAVVTFVAVFPVATVLGVVLAPAMQTWHFLLGNAVFNLCVVILLTWLVMPLLTRLLHGWLHPEAKAGLR